jgi:hypothetical protein
MLAFALKGAQLASDTQQHNLAVADLHIKASVFRYIGETGDTVQGHGRAPRGISHTSLVRITRFSHFPLPRHERYGYSLQADEGPTAQGAPG